MKLTISPSILAADFSRLQEEVQAVWKAGADTVHYDVMDNHFVPNLTFGFKLVEDVMKASPLKSDVHLMIEKPEQSLEKWLKVAPDLLTFHLEASTNLSRLLEETKAAGIQCGVSIKPETPVSSLESFLDKIDTVLIMLVEPGFGGQAMLPATVAKIAETRELIQATGSSAEIQIDGGIKIENFRELVRLGAENIVMGSGIFKNDYASVIKEIREFQEEV